MIQSMIIYTNNSNLVEIYSSFGVIEVRDHQRQIFYCSSQLLEQLIVTEDTVQLFEFHFHLKNLSATIPIKLKFTASLKVIEVRDHQRQIFISASWASNCYWRLIQNCPLERTLLVLFHYRLKYNWHSI